MKTSLLMLRGLGCEHVVECQAEQAYDTVETALAADQMTIIICKCESGNIKVPVIEMDPVVIKDRFMKVVQS